MLSYDNILDFFAEISNGRTKHYLDSIHCEIFIKHPTIEEYSSLSKYYTKSLSDLKRAGILPEDDQVKFAIENGWWSSTKENQLNYIGHSIERLKKTREKIIYENDKKRINEEISKLQDELNSIRKERESYIGISAESVSNQKSCDYFVENFFFKDIDCKNKLFDQELFNNNQEKYDILFDTCLLLYYRYITNYSHITIRKIALSSTVQNILFISSNIYDIFGKPIIQLTRNQHDLILWGKYYQSIIKSIGGEVPDSVHDDPELFNEWVESRRKQNEKPTRSKPSKRFRGDDSSKKSKFLFGERDEIETMTNSKINGDEIINKSQKSGGMGFMELLNNS